MDSLDADFFATLDVYQKVINEDRLLRPYPELLQSDLEDLRFRLCRTHFRGDDHLIEGIVEFFLDDIVPQIAPGIRD